MAAHQQTYGSVSPMPSDCSKGGPEVLSETAVLLPQKSLSTYADEALLASEPYGQPYPWSAWLSESRVIVGYTGPLLISSILEYSLSITSVVSVGHIGTTELAAFSLAQGMATVTGWTMITGAVSALDTLLAQAWGSKDPNQKHLVGLWTQRMCVLISILVIPILALWRASYSILILLGQEPEVAHFASLYLKYLSFALPADAFAQIALKYYISIGILHVPSLIISVIAPFTVLLNYILVWGPGPFASLRLGFIGAPIATSISRNITVVAYLIHARLYIPREAWSPLNNRESICKVLSPEALILLVKLTAAGIGQTASDWWSWEIITLAASVLGPTSLASQSVLMVIAETCDGFPSAICAAATVRVGNLVGMGAGNRARLATYVSLLIVVGACGSVFMVLLIFHNSWGYLFNNDVEVVRLVARVLPLVAVVQVLDGLAGLTGGLLRVAGLQSIGALLNLVGYWAIGKSFRIPIGLVLTFYFPKLHLGLFGLWIGLCVALIFIVVFQLWYSLTINWGDEVRKANARLHQGEDDGKGSRCGE